MITNNIKLIKHIHPLNFAPIWSFGIDDKPIFQVCAEEWSRDLHPLDWINEKLESSDLAKDVQEEIMDLITANSTGFIDISK